MHEVREIDRSARPVQGKWCRELLPGKHYFVVSCSDGAVNLPEIETLVYLGSAQMIAEDGRALTGFLFQDARSYYQDGDWSRVSEEQGGDLAAQGSVMFYDADTVATIADIDGLLPLLNDLREHMRLLAKNR